VGIGRQRAGWISPEHASLAPGDNDERSIWQPVEAEREQEGHSKDDLAPALRIHGQDLLSAPVREPETAVVPARRFAHGQACQQDLRYGCVERFLWHGPLLEGWMSSLSVLRRSRARRPDIFLKDGRCASASRPFHGAPCAGSVLR